MDEHEFEALATRVNGLADQIAEEQGYVKAADGQWRRPAKAIGAMPDDEAGNRLHEPDGRFITALMQARSRDAEEQTAGKATLHAMSSYVGEQAIRAYSKATLGTTDATGGWIVPNALVDQLTKPEGYRNPFRDLVTLRPGVTALAVDIPFRSARPARAVIASFGATKENVDLAYNGYTATMYTLARIHDIGNQFLRSSAGAAEADVMEELGTAIQLGEAYYMREGSGSSEPYGLYTALTNSPSTFTSSFTPSASTLAGSVLKAITTCLGALADRGVTRGISAVISGTAWGEMVGQGTDTAGFFIAGSANAPAVPGVAPGTIVTPWGTPVHVDDQATDDRLVVGQYKSLKLYTGADYRVDSSSQAGTRWDENLTGFRGEEDIAFDARPAVYAGRFQQVTNLLA
jgi:HK97 family phage major capsid protein